MQTYPVQTLIDNLAFPEGPRWHEGRLWFTDQHAHAIYAADVEGCLETISITSDLPGGLCWLPDGSTLVVYMTERRVMRLSGSTLTEYADLSRLASFHCNDMLADKQGRVYVGNFGFDLHGGAAVNNAEIILIQTNGEMEIFTNDVIFPNGSVITPDGQTLIVAETFGHRLTAFQLGKQGRMKSHVVWANLGDVTPDGICLDAENAIWVASPGTNQLIRIEQGGEIIAQCETQGTPYACMLGGEDRQTLFICTSDTDDPKEAARLKSGRIEQARVHVPGAGLP